MVETIVRKKIREKQITISQMDKKREMRSKIKNMALNGKSKVEIAHKLRISVNLVNAIEEDLVLTRETSKSLIDKAGEKVKQRQKEKNKEQEKNKLRSKWNNSFLKLLTKDRSKNIDKCFLQFLTSTIELYENDMLEQEEIKSTQSLIVSAMQDVESADIRVKAYQLLLKLSIKIKDFNQAVIWCNQVQNEDFTEEMKVKFMEMRKHLTKTIKLKRIARKLKEFPYDAIAMLAEREGLLETEVRLALRIYGKNVEEQLDGIDLEL